MKAKTLLILMLASALILACGGGGSRTPARTTATQATTANGQAPTSPPQPTGDGLNATAQTGPSDTEQPTQALPTPTDAAPSATQPAPTPAQEPTTEPTARPVDLTGIRGGVDSPLAIPAATLRKLGLTPEAGDQPSGTLRRLLQSNKGKIVVNNDWSKDQIRGFVGVADQRYVFATNESAKAFYDGIVAETLKQLRENTGEQGLKLRDLKGELEVGDERRVLSFDLPLGRQGSLTFYAVLFHTDRVVGAVLTASPNSVPKGRHYKIVRAADERVDAVLGG